MRLQDLAFFRGKATAPAPVHEAHDLVILTAEDEWFVAGAAGDLAELARGLPAGYVRQAGGRLRMKFVNEVGRFAIPGAGVLELSSGKWRDRDFDAMLADLARIAAGLPFAERVGPGVAITHERPTDESSLYHAFIYLRQILSPAAPRGEQLETAIAAILAEPHERLLQEQRSVPIHAVRGVSGPALQRAMTRGDTWQRVAKGAVSTDWSRAFGDFVPRSLESPTSRPSRDTAENRFVKHFLTHARAIVRAMAEHTRHGDGLFRQRVTQDAGLMLQRLDALLRARLWRDVGELGQVPAGSRVLQSRRGYVDILRHDTHMRCLAEVSALREVWRDLIAVKQVSRLYEVWCFFAVVEALKGWLGEPIQARITHEVGLTESLREGVEVTWAAGIRALYNPTFPQPAGRNGHHSYSVELRPDICVVVPEGSAPGLYILDAKFAREIERDSAKTADLHKMHVYRDALRMRVGPGPTWYVRPGRCSRGKRTALQPGPPRTMSRRSSQAWALSRFDPGQGRPAATAHSRPSSEPCSKDLSSGDPRQHEELDAGIERRLLGAGTHRP